MLQFLYKNIENEDLIYAVFIKVKKKKLQLCSMD